MNEEAASRFDALSRATADAYARGDQRLARQLGDQAMGLGIPRLTELSRRLGYRQHLREDMLAHALLRIASDWARGTAPEWKMLVVIFKRAAYDVDQAATGRIEMASLSSAASDDLVGFLAAESVAGTVADPVDEILTDVQLQQLAAEFAHLNRPAWAAYITAWRGGHRSGPDIARFIGIKPGRARQIRMDVRQYIAAMHPELAVELFANKAEATTSIPTGDVR